MAALFTIAKIWKQPQCPEDMVYISHTHTQTHTQTHTDTMDCCSAYKEWTFAICNYMNELGRHQAKWNKQETNSIWHHLYGESKK